MKVLHAVTSDVPYDSLLQLAEALHGLYANGLLGRVRFNGEPEEHELRLEPVGAEQAIVRLDAAAPPPCAPCSHRENLTPTQEQSLEGPGPGLVPLRATTLPGGDGLHLLRAVE